MDLKTNYQQIQEKKPHLNANYKLLSGLIKKQKPKISKVIYIYIYNFFSA